MYDLAYIIDLFNSLPASDQQDLIDLAARLAAESQSNDQ